MQINIYKIVIFTVWLGENPKFCLPIHICICTSKLGVRTVAHALFLAP